LRQILTTNQLHQQALLKLNLPQAAVAGMTAPAAVAAETAVETVDDAAVARYLHITKLGNKENI
jgi:hypothetical protein